MKRLICFVLLVPIMLFVCIGCDGDDSDSDSDSETVWELKTKTTVEDYTDPDNNDAESLTEYPYNWNDSGIMISYYLTLKDMERYEYTKREASSQSLFYYEVYDLTSNDGNTFTYEEDDITYTGTIEGDTLTVTGSKVTEDFFDDEYTKTETYIYKKGDQSDIEDAVSYEEIYGRR